MTLRQRGNASVAIRNGFVAEHTRPTHLLSLPDEILMHIMHATLVDDVIHSQCTYNSTDVRNLAQTCVRMWNVLQSFLRLKDLSWDDISSVSYFIDCVKCKSKIHDTFERVVTQLAPFRFKHINLENVCYHHKARLLRNVSRHCHKVVHLSFSDTLPRGRSSDVRQVPFDIPFVTKLTVKFPTKSLFLLTTSLPHTLRELTLNTVAGHNIPVVIQLFEKCNHNLRSVQIFHILVMSHNGLPTPHKLQTVYDQPSIMPKSANLAYPKLVSQHARYILSNFEPRDLLITSFPSQMRYDQQKHHQLFGTHSNIVCSSSFTTTTLLSRIDKTPDAPPKACTHLVQDEGLSIMLPNQRPQSNVPGNLLRWCKVVRMPFERAFDPWNVFATHCDFSQLRQVTISNPTMAFFNSIQLHIGYTALYKRFLSVLKSAASMLTVVEMRYVGRLASPPRMMISMLRHVPCISALVLCGDFLMTLDDKMSDLFKLARNVRSLHFVDLVSRQTNREKVGRIYRRFDFLYVLPSLLLCMQLYCHNLREVIVLDHHQEDISIKFDSISDICLDNINTALDNVSRANEQVDVSSLRSWFCKWKCVLSQTSFSNYHAY